MNHISNKIEIPVEVEFFMKHNLHPSVLLPEKNVGLNENHPIQGNVR